MTWCNIPIWGQPVVGKAHLPDLIGASILGLPTRVGRLETMIDDRVSVTDIRSPVSGTGPGEDFSI